MRKMLGGERLAVTLQRCAEEHAGELADIARPTVAHQHRKRVVADRQRLQACLLRQTRKEMSRQRRNVAAPVAERRQDDRGGADPLAKTGMEVLRQRPAGSGDDPHVDRLAAVEPDGTHLAGRQHAIECLLRFGRKRADLVE